MRRVYLDHTATTPLDPRVLQEMQPYFSDMFGNASSVHWFGQQARSVLEKSRETIARLIGAQSGEVFFTSGGTESDNLALWGAGHSALKKGKRHIITSRAEHHAVLDTCDALEEEGFLVTRLDVDEYGSVSPSQVEDAITNETFLVSIMHANNEVGTISPVREIARLAHGHGVLVHTDAVQTAGKIPLDVTGLGVDLMTISAHKIYGPKGIGALYIRKGAEVAPMLRGGGQERGKRPGTENVPLVAGFAKAMSLAVEEMSSEARRIESLRDTLEANIRSGFPEALINGSPDQRLPNILNISFDSKKVQLEGEMLLMNLDLYGIAVTSGSACTSGSMQPSHVLLAMGRDSYTAKATLRFSFGRSNTGEDVRYVVETLGEVLRQMVK